MRAETSNKFIQIVNKLKTCVVKLEQKKAIYFSVTTRTCKLDLDVLKQVDIQVLYRMLLKNIIMFLQHDSKEYIIFSLNKNKPMFADIATLISVTPSPVCAEA